MNPAAEFNRVRGTVKDMAYFGSYTVYHLLLASGAVLKISASNSERHRDQALSWGDDGLGELVTDLAGGADLMSAPGRPKGEYTAARSAEVA